LRHLKSSGLSFGFFYLERLCHMLCLRNGQSRV